MDERAETVRVGREVVVTPKGGRVILDPSSPIPTLSARRQLRFKPTIESLGIIERLARLRYEADAVKPSEPTLWSHLPTNESEIISPIAQSVWASTEIEGESVHAGDVNLAIVGKPTRAQSRIPDYEDRVRGTKAVYEAYLWALQQPFPLAGNQVITVEFVTELHRRMFSSTKPEAAGKIKVKQNRVQWGGAIELDMLPPEKVDEFLGRLCDRLNSCFSVAESTGRCCRLISVAEFVVDFLAIHPFRDGNGRTARLLSTYLLERAGYQFARFYSLDTIILERQQKYYKALFESQRHWFSENEDLTAWIEFYLDAVFTQWLRAHEAIALAAS